jgi:ribosome biogenesis GTPase
LTKQYGYSETTKPIDGLQPARVTAVHRERYELISDNGLLFGKLKTSVYYGAEDEIFPTVGDFVLFRHVEGGDCQIVKTLPRKSYFARSDPDPNGGKQQAVAANFDTVFIMSSLNQDFNVNRIQRYLVLVRQSGATPVVVLTKADLSADVAAQVAAVQDIDGAVDVIPVSALCGMGLSNLEAYLVPGQTVVFLGMSGVGKSSLLNAVMGHDVMTVSEIREDDSRGRHTTTHRQLVMLPSGAMIIDTPGMRSIGMWDADEGLSETFADVEALLGSCRFSDCRHESEPGCAVRAATESGAITAERLENYDKLRRESAYAERKAHYMQIKQERNKSISKWSRQQKKNGGFKNNRT